jgi:hypothetical protein
MSKQSWFEPKHSIPEWQRTSANKTGIDGELCRKAVLSAFCLLGIAACSELSPAQAAPTDPNSQDPGAAIRELQSEVRELRATVAELRSDSERTHAETRELQHQIEELRAVSAEQKTKVLEAVARTPAEGFAMDAAKHLAASLAENLQGSGQASQSRDQTGQRQTGHAAGIEEEYELLSGKVDDQYQTKVESASKYRMRLSGIVLMNLFSNQGTVDSIDLPSLAYPRPAGGSGGSFGATVRQSEIGFEVFGPRVAGARTKADLQLDLAGGFSSIPDGVNSGLARLRTATMHLDWENTSIVAGQDTLFFSPSSPTSFATLATPALSYAGNLWGWIPQIRVEHKISLGDSSSLLLQGGILDPVSGEVPANTPYRAPGAGEASRQPAFGTRIAWTRNFFGQPLRLGLGGFYSRQDYGFERTVDGWAAMSDLELPLGPKFTLSGKAYRGRALGGLYGGIGRSVLFEGKPTNAYSEVIGLNTVGGWTQLKYKATNKLEFNVAFGIDNPYAANLEYFQYPQSYGDPSLSRNRAGFANFIYRPRSDLLFSAEYRQIETNSIVTGLSGAGHLNLSMGVLF